MNVGKFLVIIIIIVCHVSLGISAWPSSYIILWKKKVNFAQNIYNIDTILYIDQITLSSSSNSHLLNSFSYHFHKPSNLILKQLLLFLIWLDNLLQNYITLLAKMFN